MKVFLLSLALILNASWVSQWQPLQAQNEKQLTNHQQLYFSPVDLTQGVERKNTKAKNNKEPLAKNLWVFEVDSSTPSYEIEESTSALFSPIPLFILFCSYLL